MPTNNEANTERVAARKGGAGIVLLLGGGCAVLLLIVTCAGVGVGIWLWNRTPAGQVLANLDGNKPKNPDGKAGPDKDNPPKDNPPKDNPPKDNPPKDKPGDGLKPKNPLKASGPVAKVDDSEFGPPNDIWNYSIRMPKELVLRFKDKKDGGTGDASYFDWVTPEANEDTPGRACNVLRQKIVGNLGDLSPFILLTANRKLKSKPGAFYPFDTVLLPEEVEVNGIAGARMWQLYTSKDKFTFSIEYRFQADDWSIYMRAAGVGKTEAEARRHAEVVDAAICTLRKR